VAWNRVEDADPAAIPGSRRGRNTPNSGFKAAVFQREGSDQHVLVFAGTDGLLDRPDWRTNLRQGLGLGAAQYRQAVNYAYDKQAQYGDKLTHISGHSLGGGLATTASAATGIPAVVFNPAGVHRNTLKSIGVDYKKFSQKAEAGQVRNYIVRGEVLDIANTSPLVPSSLGAKIRLRDPAHGLPHARHQMPAVQRAMDASGLFPDRSKAASKTASLDATGSVQADAALSTDPQQRQKAMAKAFRENPALALEAYPELEKAHKTLSAIRVSAGPRRNRVVPMMQEYLAKRIERGNPIPTPKQARQMVYDALGGHER